MSISPSRVVGRILDQVLTWPADRHPVLVFQGEDLEAPGDRALLEVAFAPRNRFPTLLHFWALGLRRHLARQGAERQFMGAGSYSICEQVTGEAFSRALERQRASLRDPSRWTVPDRPWEVGYRMIESTCRVSYAGEGREHLLVFYWSHGQRDRETLAESVAPPLPMLTP